MERESEVCGLDGIDVWCARMRQHFVLGSSDEAGDRVREAVRLGTTMKLPALKVFMNNATLHLFNSARLSAIVQPLISYKNNRSPSMSLCKS